MHSEGLPILILVQKQGKASNECPYVAEPSCPLHLTDEPIIAPAAAVALVVLLEEGGGRAVLDRVEEEVGSRVYDIAQITLSDELTDIAQRRIGESWTCEDGC